MNLIRLNPGRTLPDLRDEFDRVVSHFFGGISPEEATFTTFAPAVDIEEHEKELVVMAELPGVKKDDVKVNLQNRVLTISGEKKQEKKVNRENLHRSERIYGKFQRCFRLPETADQDLIAAEFRDGILKIVVPKKIEALPKQLEIKVN